MLKFTESDRLLVQIQAYLDNVFDVGALLEDAETKNTLLEHLEELQELNAQVGRHMARTQSSSTVRQITSCVRVSQLSSRLQESERDAMEKVSQLEKNLLQTTKEVALLKVKSAVLLGHLFCLFLRNFSELDVCLAPPSFPNMVASCTAENKIAMARFQTSADGFMAEVFFQ